MIASTKVTEKAENRWTLIVERFRSACVLHREGGNVESRRIIKDELPELIKAWIQLLPRALKEDAKADLRDMFTREQSIVDQGFKLQSIFKETLIKSIIPQVEEQVAAKYRRLYLQEQQKRKQRREEDVRKPWNASGLQSRSQEQPFPRKRIGLDNVQEMIDAVQEQENEMENERLADSVLSLDEIVTTLNREGITPLLAEENIISI